MNILLAIDDHATGFDAAVAARDWLPDDASVVALHVGERISADPAATAAAGTGGAIGVPLGGYPSTRLDLYDHAADDARERARRVAEEAAARAGADARVETGDPASTIISVAEEIDADLIVIGTQDRSWLSRIFEKSVSDEVVRKAPCSVLVVRSPDRD